MIREDAASRAQAALFATLMIENITKDDRKYVKRRVGRLNREFANKFGKNLVKIFGENGEHLLNTSYNDFVKEIRDLYNLINER